MKTTIPKLRRMIRQVIKESYEEGGYNSVAGKRERDNARRNSPPTLPQTLEAIEIIEVHGGTYNSSVSKAGEGYSDDHREVLTGRAGNVAFQVSVTPNSFYAQIIRPEYYNCHDINEFEEVLASYVE